MRTRLTGFMLYITIEFMIYIFTYYKVKMYKSTRLTQLNQYQLHQNHLFIMNESNQLNLFQ